MKRLGDVGLQKLHYVGQLASYYFFFLVLIHTLPVTLDQLCINKLHSEWQSLVFRDPLNQQDSGASLTGIGW